METGNFELMFRNIKRLLGIKKDKELADKLDITPQAIAGAKRKGVIPSTWLDILEERHNIPREAVQATHKVRSSIEAAYNITQADRDGTATNEDSLPMVRNYRELARMDADTLGEIQTWLNDMERWRPGFTGWFRLEFQNRFPEFDEWKQRVIKKSVGAGD